MLKIKEVRSKSRRVSKINNRCKNEEIRNQNLESN
jgi:hypothetical protein